MIVARETHYPSFKGFSSTTGMEDQAVASGVTRYQRRAHCLRSKASGKLNLLYVSILFVAEKWWSLGDTSVTICILAPRHLVTRRGLARFSESPGYREPNNSCGARHDLADSKSEDSTTGSWTLSKHYHRDILTTYDELVVQIQTHLFTSAATQRSLNPFQGQGGHRNNRNAVDNAMADLVLGWTSTERCDLPWGLSPSKVPASFCKHARDPTRRSCWVPGARTAVQSAVVRAGNVHKNKESDCLGGHKGIISYQTLPHLFWLHSYTAPLWKVG